MTFSWLPMTAIVFRDFSGLWEPYFSIFIVLLFLPVQFGIDSFFHSETCLRYGHVSEYLNTGH